jgi:CBS domain-containing protein
MRQMAEIVRRQVPLVLMPDSTVQQACAQLQARKVGAVLVADAAGRLVGIFTGRDAVRCLAERADGRDASLAEMMTRDPQTIGPGANAVEALRIMNDCGFRHVPIVDQGRIVGVVSKGDFRGLEMDRLDEETGYWERI